MLSTTWKNHIMLGIYCSIGQYLHICGTSTDRRSRIKFKNYSTSTHVRDNTKRTKLEKTLTNPNHLWYRNSANTNLTIRQLPNTRIL